MRQKARKTSPPASSFLIQTRIPTKLPRRSPNPPPTLQSKNKGPGGAEPVGRTHMLTVFLNSLFSRARAARTAIGVRFGWSASDVRKVFSWTFGRNGSSVHLPAIFCIWCLRDAGAAAIADHDDQPQDAKGGSERRAKAQGRWMVEQTK